MKNIPDYIAVYDDPTSGISEGDVTFKLKKSFPLRLAERGTRKCDIYYDSHISNRTLYCCNLDNPCVKKINCKASFIRSFAKPKQRYLVTEAVVTEVVEILLDPENKFSSPLPKRDCRFVGFSDGYYNLIKGKFKRPTPSSGSYPGYQRYVLQTRCLNKDKCSAYREELVTLLGSPNRFYDLIRVISSLLSGYPVQRCLFWGSNADTADLLQSILKALLPQDGAITELYLTDSKPEFEDAAKSDAHATFIRIRNATELSGMAWKKLKILAEAKKPSLVVTAFKPFLPYDVDSDGTLKNSLFLMPVVTKATEFANNLQTKPDWLAVLASESVRFLHELINRIDPDTAPDIDELLSRPDPNDIPAMMEIFINNWTQETGSESDNIPLKNDFCIRLSEYVEQAGGDPKLVTANGVGKYLADLGIKKEAIKLPGCKSKIMCLVKRKWKLPDSQTLTQEGGAHYVD